VVVQLSEEYRRDPQALARLPLSAPGGQRLVLGQIAQLEIVDAPEAIFRENGQRRLLVQANVRGRDLGGFVHDAHQRIAAAIQLPPGYYLQWGGQYENQARAMQRLTIIVPLSLLSIALLLYNTFGRWRQALVVLIGVPFGLVGGIAALWIRGLHLNLAASVGFLALFGVAVLNGVVLVSAINRLREEGEGLRRAVARGARQRLKPVLMTATVASFGFLPMALSHSTGAEIQRPLASVVIGGIVSSMLLTLIVLPSLYEWTEERFGNREHHTRTEP
jgi:cobalt-zinc-cadmium resistance protein CzcA